MTKKKSSQKKEIMYHLVNSFLAGALVFFGSLTQGFTWQGVGFGFIAGLVIACTKFKEFWETQESEYKYSLFSIL